MAANPLCFVLMPFGRKRGEGGRIIDFDSVYTRVIKGAIEQANLEPLRADEEEVGGIIHKSMFERLVLCEYAIADLTTANANVFYELGVRHAAKPHTTVLLYACGHGQLPFDLAPLHAIGYELGGDGRPAQAGQTQRELASRLVKAKSRVTLDSPLYQLLTDYPNIAHEKTDVFRDRVAYETKVKTRLAQARKGGVQAIQEVEEELGLLREAEAGIVVDIFLSYRSVSAWNEMIRVYQSMNEILQRTTLVQEQLGLALNRAGRGEEAEGVLTNLIQQRGPSSETLGILGRVYKDQWQRAVAQGAAAKAEGLLRKVVNTYRRGFESDWRDAYPGVNALTFLRILNGKNQEYFSLLPVVWYAVRRKMSAGDPDYWDYATCLELAVLDGDEDAARRAMADALGMQRESWETKTTAKNLRMIRESVAGVDQEGVWIGELERELEKASTMN